MANDKSELSDALGVSELRLADEATTPPESQTPTPATAPTADDSDEPTSIGAAPEPSEGSDPPEYTALEPLDAPIEALQRAP